MQDLNNKATALNHNQTARNNQHLPANDPYAEVVLRPVELTQAEALDLVTDKMLTLQEQIRIADTITEPQAKESLLADVKKLTEDMYALIDKAIAFSPLLPRNEKAVRKLLEKRAQLIGLFLCLNFSCYLPAVL